MSIQNLFFYLLTYYFGLLGLTKFTCQHADVDAIRVLHSECWDSFSQPTVYVISLNIFCQ